MNKYKIETYDNIFKQLVEEFINVYYTYDDGSVADYYIIGEGGRLAPYTIEVNEMFWNIDNIYEALKHDIPREKLFKRYDYANDNDMANSKQDSKKKNVFTMGLVHYVLGREPYTKEQIKEDKAHIKRAKKLLKLEIQ